MSPRPPELDIDWLARLHAEKPLAVRTSDGGFLTLDDSGAAFVSELIRLARIGAKVEAAAAATARRLDV